MQQQQPARPFFCESLTNIERKRPACVVLLPTPAGHPSRPVLSGRGIDSGGRAALSSRLRWRAGARQRCTFPLARLAQTTGRKSGVSRGSPVPWAQCWPLRARSPEAEKEERGGRERGRERNLWQVQRSPLGCAECRGLLGLLVLRLLPSVGVLNIMSQP